MNLNQARYEYSKWTLEERSRQVKLIYEAITRALTKAVEDQAEVAVVNIPTGVDIDLVIATKAVYKKKFGGLYRIDEIGKGKHYKITLTIWL